MSDQDFRKLKYPVGDFVCPESISKSDIESWIKTIENTPSMVHELVSSLNSRQLDFIYRPDGWTITQVVHHMSDSHINAFIRFKLSLTEDSPMIKPYMEDLWADLPDSAQQYLHHSLSLLVAIHAKWTVILKKIDFDNYFIKSYIHPQNNKQYYLGEALGLYDWHCRHHCAHIRQALRHEGKF